MKKSLIFVLIVSTIFCFTLGIGAQAINETPISSEEMVDIITYDYINHTEEITPASEYLVNNASMNSNSDIMNTASAYIPSNIPLASENLSPKSIIGSDNRSRVNPTQFPYSAVTYLYLGQDTTGNGVANSWGSGTGFMVGSKAMVTAGHCYWSGTYGWVEECRTYIKQNSSTLGSTYYYPASWQVPSEYTSSLNYKYDWCVVKMQNALGSQTGYFGYGKGGSMLNNTYTISGYPGDHNGYQYKSTGTVSSETTYICKYNNDTKPGTSGAPIYDSNHTVWGINTYEASTFNQGNRITTQLYDLITAARNAT